MQLVIPFETYSRLYRNMELLKSRYNHSIVLFKYQYQYYFTQDLERLCPLLNTRPEDDQTILPCTFGRFPEAFLDTYLPKLIKSGYRVAVCDNQ